jgi:hypothetical protein
VFGRPSRSPFPEVGLGIFVPTSGRDETIMSC